MKTILTVWAIVFALYSLTPLAIADERIPRAVVPVWAAYAVVGDVCVEIRDKATGEYAEAEFWLVNEERVQWFSDAAGYLCMPVEFSKETQLYAVVYDRPVSINVVKDTTTSYFSIELPLEQVSDTRQY